MTKLELSVSTETYECVSCTPETAEILGCTGMPVHMSALLANLDEFYTFKDHVKDMMDSKLKFTSLNVVFSAPNICVAGLPSDRRALEGVFSSPMRAIHVCGDLQIACFAHIQWVEQQNLLKITALEYSRKQRENMLRQEFGSWLLEKHIEKSVIATTMMGEIVFWNDFASKLYQVPREEAMGKSVMNITPSDMTMEQATEIMGNLSQGKHWSGMFQCRRKDGTKFMAHVSDTPIMDGGGTVKFIVGVSDDYSQLHNVMNELERLNSSLEQEVQARTSLLLEREQNLRMVGAAIRASETGVLMTDGQHKIAWLNDAVLKLMNATQEELMEAQPWDLKAFQDHVSDDGQTLSEWVHDWLAKGNDIDSTKTADTVFNAPPGSATEAVSVVVQRVRESELGQHNMILLRDYTAQKKFTEAQLAAEAAASASETKTEMMQMLSHELRSPLQGIMGVASTMLLDLNPEEDQVFDGLSTVLASSRLLLTLINNMLDSRKVELDMMQDIELGPVPVAQCLEDSKRFCSAFASVNEVELVTNDMPEEAEVTYASANRLRLEQVLINLITNSIKYTTPRTQCIISSREATYQEALVEARCAVASDLAEEELADDFVPPDGKVVVISVRDYGRGIPLHEAHKVFKPYTQLSISKEKDKSKNPHFVGQASGTGLGLSLVTKFLAKMGGHIWCSNCPNQGAEFCFYLPLYEGLVEDDVKEKLEEVPALTPAIADRFRVLIVDDSVINVKVIARMASRLGVTQIEPTYSGIDALRYLNDLLEQKQESGGNSVSFPNLIISDLQMPEMNGDELAGHILELNLPNDPLMVACTADWTGDLEQQCRSVGFSHVLRKPITIQSMEHFLAMAANNMFNR